MAPKSREVYLIEGDIVATHDSDKGDPRLYEKEYNYEDALDIIGFGKVHLAALIICGLILMAVICETMGMMIIVIASRCDLSLEDYQKGLLTGVAFFGILISSYFWGFFSDRYGRKSIILYSTYASVFFSCASVLTNNFWIFLILRLCSGISISGPSAAIYAYLGEFNTMKNRQTTISWASIFVGLANTFIPGMAWLILPQTWSYSLYGDVTFRPWQLALIMYTFPGLLGATLMIWMPETPKFLLSQNREREAFKIVEWMYVKNTGRPAHTFIVQKLQPEGDKEYLESLNHKQGCGETMLSVWHQIAPLLRRPHIVNLLMCCVIQFGIFFASAGLGLWLPEILNRFNSITGDVFLTVCDVIDLTESAAINDNSTIKLVCDDGINPKVFMDSIMLGVSYVIGYAVLAIIINPVGRQIILPSVLLASGFSGVALIWVTEPTAVVLLFCGFLMLSGLCVSVVNGAIVDLIPTHMRGMAVCVQLSMGRLGSIVGSNIVGYSIYKDCLLTFSFYSGFLIFCGLLSILLAKKPKPL